MSGTLVVIQAVAAAVSALTAVYLVRVTLRRDRDAREERERDLVHEQLRRLVDALRGMARVMHDLKSSESDFQIARMHVATALAIRPVHLPACDSLLRNDMPIPPYAMGEVEPWKRLELAIEDVLAYSRSRARHLEPL